MNSNSRYLKKRFVNFLRIARSAARKFKSTEHTFIVFIAIIIGLLGGFGAVGIYYGIEFFEDMFWGTSDLSVDFFTTIPWWLKILIPTVAGFIVGLIIHLVAREAKGHGVPEVMEAIALRGGVIRKRVAAAKLIASSLYIGGGGSVGREGPVIQIGSAIGSAMGQLFHVNAQRMKTFVACGAAAGIAAAFNAPIAGALFSLEIILGDFAVPKFSPIVIAAVTATVVSHTFLGDHTAFQIPKYELISAYELIPYAILGLFAGFVAWLFIKSLHNVEGFFDKFRYPIYLKTLVGGLIVGIIGCFIPHIYGVGYDTMDNALRGNLVGHTLLILVFAKIFATSISLGSGGSGGVFAPSLFMGTTAGGFFGVLVHSLFPEITATPGAYALVGMGAVVAATTHAPITAILIIFEMTNDYHIILPLMISVTIGVIFRGKLMRESIYTIKLVAKGIDIFRGQDANVLRAIKVRSVMDKEIELMPEHTPFRTIINRTLETPLQHFWVIDRGQQFIGAISLPGVRQILHEEEYLRDLVVAHDLVDVEVPVICADATLAEAMQIFGRYDVDLMPVVENSNSRKLIGQLRLRDVIEAYNNEIHRADVTSELAHSVKLLEQTKTVDFIDGYTLAEIKCPDGFVGKNLRILPFRQEYQTQVILIKRKNGIKEEEAIVPTPTEQLLAEDQLVLVGPEKKIDALKNL
ncbi:MAG: chloride channel protein [Deferribacteres bacterium]|nr:chloride channel protein [candidate division KSB1 bacterium]MCB9500743.1 chloride channel protein [Deferribacteres bacterium]